MAKPNEKWVRIMFAAPVNGRLTAKERGARKRLEAAIEQAMQEFHEVGNAIDGLEMYPTE